MDNTQILKAYQEGEFEQVLKLLEETTEPLSYDLTGIKGESLHRLKRYEDAMNVWNLAIANFGDQPEFYAERGVCKFHLRFKSAMEDLNKAVELDPENGYRYACRAYVKDKIGDTEGAIADYMKANELDPGNEITLNNLGLAEEKLGHTKRAREQFRKADQIAGVDHITNKYFDQEEKAAPLSDDKATIGTELRKMMSSKAEFKSFWNDALKLLGFKK